MPLYEYYCDSCGEVFEALRSIKEPDEPSPCPKCGRQADRIMPTSFAAMSFNKGYPQRVPYHHRPIRNVEPKTPAKPSIKVKAKSKGKSKSGTKAKK